MPSDLQWQLALTKARSLLLWAEQAEELLHCALLLAPVEEPLGCLSSVLQEAVLSLYVGRARSRKEVTRMT